MKWPPVLVALLMLPIANAGNLSASDRKRSIEESFERLPLRFEPAVGRGFVARGGNYTLALTGGGAVACLDANKSNLFRLKVEGASASAVGSGVSRLPGHSNYLIGNDPAQWRTNVPQYERVRFDRVYPGVDLIYYSKGGQLEYDFVVAPGADPAPIRLSFGDAKIRLNAAGDLLVTLVSGEVVHRRPLVYQEVDGERRIVESHYEMAGNQVSFRLGRYDRSRELIIDPVLSFSTFLGGSRGERASGIAVDGAGNIYITGATNSTNFPVMGGTQSAISGGSDVFIAKMNNAGTALIYSTFLGGSFNGQGFGEDAGLDIAVDSGGNAYVAGTTSSANFPVTSAYRSTYGGNTDGFVVKLNNTGTGLVYSTYLGGKEMDEAFALALDNGGSAYVVGHTASDDLAVSNAFQAKRKGGETDAFVLKLNPSGSGIAYATFLGGSDRDSAWDITIDGAGSVYVVGQTKSTDFPTAGAYQAQNQGDVDGFLTKLTASGTMAFSTYLGAKDRDAAFGVALDGGGNIYVAGRTASPAFPIANAVQKTFGGFSDAFVTKFNPSASSIIYSTFLGGSVSDAAFDIAVDASGQAHITGFTWSDNFPLQDPIQKKYGGAFSDGFAAKLGAGGNTLIYSTYLGGKNEDNSDDSVFYLSIGGVALDSSGNAYYTGRTDSEDFPVTQGTLQPAFAGRSFAVGDANVGDVFVTKINGASSSPNPNPTPTSSGLRFVPVVPCRIADTRTVAFKPAIVGGTARTFAVTGGSCGIPAGASAFSLNVTVVPTRALGYLTIWPAGENRPLVSTLNSFDGRVKANAAIVPAGTNGSVSVYATDTTDVVLDVNGYFTSNPGEGLAYYPITPCRVSDTRNPQGPYGGPSMDRYQTRAIAVWAANCGAPATAKAYALNITAIPKGTLSYLSAWPTGAPQPLVSTLNSFTGAITANAAIVPAGPDGGINLYTTHPADVVIDINGYFAQPNPGGLTYYRLTPCRVSDSRNAAGPFGAPGVAAGASRFYTVPQSACGVPASAKAYSFNATVLPKQILQYLTIWPSGTQRPEVSTLNSFDGSVVSNAVFAPAALDGSIGVFATDYTDLLLDINGYFAP